MYHFKKAQLKYQKNELVMLLRQKMKVTKVKLNYVIKF